MIARRPLRTLMLAALVLAGAVHRHLDGETLDAQINLQPGLVQVQDPPSHGHKLHIDPLRLVQRPVCPACVHHLRTSGAQVRAAIALLPALRALGGTGRRTVGVSLAFYRPNVPRGPPLLLG
jgi:hypothetical protein